MLCVVVYRVPQALLEQLEEHPEVKQWMMQQLKMTDMQHRAPTVKQANANPFQLAQGGSWLTAASFLADMFDSEQHFPDTKVIIGGRTIHLHKCIVARGCSAFAARWTSNWADSSNSSSSTNSQDSAILDTACCDACGVQTSYDTAGTFFRFFYTGEGDWPAEQPELTTAMELLVLADLYQVPYFVCAAEQALKSGMTASQYCQVLLVADHHSAQQLRKYCLHVIASGYDMVSQHPSFQQLTGELLDEIEQTREALQQLDDQ